MTALIWKRHPRLYKRCLELTKGDRDAAVFLCILIGKTALNNPTTIYTPLWDYREFFSPGIGALGLDALLEPDSHEHAVAEKAEADYERWGT